MQYTPKHDLKSDPNVIIWNEKRPLSWEDYQGKADSLIPHSAMTANSVFADCKAKLILTKTKVKFQITDIQVHAYMIKSMSWVKQELVNQQGSERILKHEQGHFDITEIFVRKLMRKMEMETTKKHTCKGKTPQEQQAFAEKESQRILQEITDEISSERAKFNNKYESEKNHGMNIAIQKMYDEKIAKLLKINSPGH